MVKSSEIVGKLNLRAHQEGGFFAETFRDSSVFLSTSQLPPTFKVDRAVSTSIYFLLPSGSVSRLHRIPMAETWHFYLGEPLTVVELYDDGKLKFTCLGPDLVEGEGQRRHESRKPRAEFQEEQARVLSASLRHVPRLGWTEEAMMAGSRDVGVSPSIVGSFSRKEAALVEFFMDECLQLLVDRIDSGLDLQNLIPSERIAKLIRIRLEMQVPYMSKWPQALSIQAHPLNVPTSFKQRAMLVDEIWHAVGDGASDLDWYVKRTILGGVYSTTEIYMLTDDSLEHRDTWAFLDDRVKDAFDLKKSIQEAKYFAEDIGAGVGKSVQGLMNGVMQTMSRSGGSAF